MSRRAEIFLEEQKVLRLATVDGSGEPHVVPVWYLYRNSAVYIGTNTRTIKARNVREAGGGIPVRIAVIADPAGNVFELRQYVGD